MIDLEDYERGRKYQGRYKHDLHGLQERLEHALASLIAHKRRAIIALEGWDTAGKDGIIERLTGNWSQAHYEVWPIGAPSAQELKHDFLWRFRNRLPGEGQIAIFDRTWYGRVLVERAEQLSPEAVWRAGYGKINAFEKKLVDDGVIVIKLFIHITAKEQAKRLRARLEDPWKHWKLSRNDFQVRAFRPAYLAAMAEMFERTDTELCPWKAIDGNEKKAARIAALSTIADRLEAVLPMNPPILDPAFVQLARETIGWEPDKS